MRFLKFWIWRSFILLRTNKFPDMGMAIRHWGSHYTWELHGYIQIPFDWRRESSGSRNNVWPWSSPDARKGRRGIQCPPGFLSNAATIPLHATEKLPLTVPALSDFSMGPRFLKQVLRQTSGVNLADRIFRVVVIHEFRRSPAVGKQHSNAFK
jgi:hypothetical protein